MKCIPILPFNKLIIINSTKGNHRNQTHRLKLVFSFRKLLRPTKTCYFNWIMKMSALIHRKRDELKLVYLQNINYAENERFRIGSKSSAWLNIITKSSRINSVSKFYKCRVGKKLTSMSGNRSPPDSPSSSSHFIVNSSSSSNLNIPRISAQNFSRVIRLCIDNTMIVLKWWKNKFINDRMALWQKSCFKLCGNFNAAYEQCSPIVSRFHRDRVDWIHRWHRSGSWK